MKNFKITKKLLSLVLCVLMVFSTVSVASAETQSGTAADCENGNHVFGGYVGESVAATCKTDGRETYKCSVCKGTFEMIIPKTDHNFDDDAWVTIIEAYHSTQGVKQGRRRNYCLDCGEMKLENINIPHEFAEGDTGEITRKPTCVSGGATLKKCLLCGKKQTVELPADENAHAYGDVYFTGTRPTCTTPGDGVKVCTLCNKVETVTGVYAKNEDEAHSYIPWTSTPETNLPDDAVCSDNNLGKIFKFCSGCNKTVDEKTFSAKHNIINPDGVVATCTNFGYTKGFCSTCRTHNATNLLFVDSSKHKWLEDIVIEEATCKNDGRILRRCALNRAHAEIITVKGGEHKYAGEWVVTKEAKCNEAGTKTNTCTVCKLTFTETIPADESLHIFDENNSTKHIIDGDCKLVVKETSKCTVCKKDMERDILNHDFVKRGEVAPTCSENGKIFYKCTKCSEDKIITIPADPKLHVGSGYYYDITKPTCTTEGLKAELCKKCNKAIITDETTKKVPKKGHTASAWATEVQSTCTTAGKKVRSCTNDGCGFTLTMNIAASHTFTSWAYTKEDPKENATCKKYVVRTRKCLVDGCNKTETENYYGNHVPGTYEFIKGNCTDGGIVRVTCETCKNPYKTYDVPAGAHVLNTDKGKPIEGDNNICGGMTYECFICKDESGNALKVSLTHSHTFRHIESDIEAFDPTCELPGLTGKKQCIDCFYVLPQDIIEPLGHNFVWGSKGEIYCSRCGEYEVGENVTCKHFCHNKGMVAKILVKVFSIFWKLFGNNHFCADCATPHYHEESTVIHSVKTDKKGKLVVEYSCEECKVTKKEITLK